MASESLTNTNISETYVGVLHAKGAPIPASGLQDVYDGFGNKSALKIGRDSVDVDGTLGDDFKDAIADAIYPVGSVIFSTGNDNPGSRFAGTTWVQIAEGRFIAGVGTGTDAGTEQATIAEGDDTTGRYSHTLTTDEIPPHTHPIKNSSDLGSDNNINYYGDWGNPNSLDQPSPLLPDATGGGNSHNNIPPAFGMYVWKRTA